jgi:hypothetical protein
LVNLDLPFWMLGGPDEQIRNTLVDQHFPGGPTSRRHLLHPLLNPRLRRSELNYAEAVHEYLVARARLDAATNQVPGYADAPRSWRQYYDETG